MIMMMIIMMMTIIMIMMMIIMMMMILMEDTKNGDFGYLDQIQTHFKINDLSLIVSVAQ